MTPEISIVLPVHNGQRYLPEALESIFAQTFTDWELILVDDCSTDASREIIQACARKDSRVRAIFHETNRKLPAALNTGLRQARGRLLTWTSDDNLYRPAALEQMRRFLELNPATAVVYTDYTEIDPEGRPVRANSVRDYPRLAYWNCVGASFLFRREVYEALGGYDESLFLVEDYDFWLRAAARFDITALHQDLYLYRTHSGALTSRHAARIKHLTVEILSRHLLHMRRLDPITRAIACFELSAKAREIGDTRTGTAFIPLALLLAAKGDAGLPEAIALRQRWSAEPAMPADQVPDDYVLTLARLHASLTPAQRAQFARLIA